MKKKSQFEVQSKFLSEGYQVLSKYQNAHEKMKVQCPKEHHLDHIIPQSFFDFRNKEEIEACWDIENLRWLLAYDNVSRGNRLKIEEVKNFSLKQLQLLAKASRKPKAFDLFLKSKRIPTEENLDWDNSRIKYTQLVLLF